MSTNDAPDDTPNTASDTTDAADDATEMVVVEDETLIPLSWYRDYHDGIVLYDESTPNAWVSSTKAYHIKLCR